VDNHIGGWIALCFVALLGFFHWMDLQSEKRMTSDRVSYAQDPACHTSPAVSYIPSGSCRNVIRGDRHVLRRRVCHA
jgi:hypothetical protein